MAIKADMMRACGVNLQSQQQPGISADRAARRPTRKDYCRT
jgi:hypothetical protein